MAVWKHYIALFGGFYDPGYTSSFSHLDWLLLPDVWVANYLDDLWLFDMREYKWKHIAMKDNERKPSWVFDPPSLTIRCLTVRYQPEEWVLLPFNSRRSSSPRYRSPLFSIWMSDRRGFRRVL